MTTKTAWHKPQLVVLARARPEEAVLKVCKTTTTVGPRLPGCMKDATKTCNKLDLS